MFIPPELEQELIQFAFIIDNNKKITEVYLSKGMATILEPYSKTVREGKYAYIEYNHELYCINSTETYEDEDIYFECELDSLTAGINKYGTNPIIMHIKRLLDDDRYNILDIDDPDITDLLKNFEYFRALLHKRHLEFTRTPIQEFYHDQNIEGTARLFIPDQKKLWKDDDSLLPVNKYDHQHNLIGRSQKIYFNSYRTEADYLVQAFLVLFEDRIIRLNYSDKDHWAFEAGGHKIPDTKTYLFADNLDLEDFDVPATPEGFLLLKMLDI